MAITELATVVPPPKKPREGGNKARWVSIQKDLGLQLPTDLLDFGRMYGSGRFYGGYIQVYNPLSKGYRKIIDFECDTRRLAEKLLGKQPYLVFPERPGLYPWGRDENGNDMHWLTGGKDPSTWPTIVRSRDDVYEKWDLSMTTFLAKAFTNEIRPLIWKGERFSKKRLDFTPSKK